MDAGLVDQIRYYELSLAACRARPALHRAQIAALEAHLALAERAPDAARFSAALAHGGHATLLARAGQIDRFAIDHARAHVLGDGLAASAAARAMAALAAEGDAQFPAAAAATGLAIGGVTAAGLVGEHASRLVEAAIDLACDWDPVRRDDARNRARVAWVMSRALAPGFGLAWLAVPPLRHRLPFGAFAGAALRQLVGAAIGDPPDLDGVAPAPPPPAPPLPPLDQVLGLGFEGWPAVTGDDPETIAARVAALAAGREVEAARSSARDALLLARDYATRSDEPAIVALADEALAGVDGATTPGEVQAWLGWHGEVAGIERRWWHLLVQVALWPAVAAVAAPGPAQVRPAAVVAARLLGVDPAIAISTPVVDRALERQLVHAGQVFDEDLAIVGPGAPHVAVMRRAAAERATAVIEAAVRGGATPPALADAARGFSDRDALVAHVTRTLAGAGAPRGGDGSVVLWGREVALADVDARLSEVPRPRPVGL